MGSYAQRRHQTSCVFGWIKFALLGVVISLLFQGALCDVEPTESQCRTYIEKALKEHHVDVDEDADVALSQNDEEENPPTDEFTDSTEGSVTNDDGDDDDETDGKKEDADDNDGEEGANAGEDDEVAETDEQDDNEEEEDDQQENVDVESNDDQEGEQGSDDDETKEAEPQQGDDDEKKDEEDGEKDNDDDDKEVISEEPIEIEVHEIELDADDDTDDEEPPTEDKETEESDDANAEEGEEEKDKDETTADGDDDNDDDEKEKDEVAVDVEDDDDKEQDESAVDEDDEDKAKDEATPEEGDEDGEDDENKDKDEATPDQDDEDDKEKDEERADELDTDDEKEKEEDDNEKEEEKDEVEEDKTDDQEEDGAEDQGEEKVDEEDGEKEVTEKDEVEVTDEDEGDTKVDEEETEEKVLKRDVRDLGSENAAESEAEDDETDEEKGQEAPEEELIKEVVIPDNLRPRTHISKILKLEETESETILEKTIDTTLKALKGLYDNAIKPLEMLYKYRDLSNRHFGDPEIFSKPLILFMGPWSGGKSSTINYLLDNEYSHTSLRTGAEPSPAYFNILMYGEEEEILDGTQLAADWTFSGLQKFGQGLLDRLRGIKLPNKLLEKVNIVEIPGILEIRKQVQRLFPFNDACQWFIDRADIIFLVYDPSKLDVGPETEAILDQLKGREYQTRIILNKADQVKPEELMRVQGTLIWNISPLMSSSEPPIMYSTSLWSLPYETGAPIRLLQAQERAFLRDLREAIDKRVENKIASARRFAVRVRNHAKMVDCYLTTYYNHKTIFGNRKKISDDIIEYPQKYHIYEGLSTLTNISRYDLPDPDVYRDFFKINPLYEFKKLSETCTYFRGCPINQLDVAIAYDLPELVGKYKKSVEGAKEELQKENS